MVGSATRHTHVRRPNDPVQAVRGHGRGLATVSGSVLVGYTLLAALLQHLIAASFMAAPGHC